MEKNIVLHIITGLNDGGAEAVLYRLCVFDTSCQHVVISMMDRGKYGSLLENAGVKVHYLNLKSGRLSGSGLWRLFKLIRLYKPNVVQTWMYHADLIGGVVAKLAGVHSVFWNVRHSNLEPGKSKRSTIWVAKTCAVLSRWIPEKIVYCANKAQTVHENLGYRKGIGQVIGNGYDLNSYKFDDDLSFGFREELNVLDNVFLIGMVGRYNPQKDHANLINALGLVKNLGRKFRLVLVGQNLDSKNQELLKCIEENKLLEDVVLLGQRADIPAVMNGIDLHVLSSSFGEAFPNVLAEAMACGTPCVTTDVGDAVSIVGDTGWVVPPKDSLALANALMQAIDEKSHHSLLWLKRKQACRVRIVDNFSIEKMIQAYHRVWFKT